MLEPLVKRVENLRVESAALMHELEAATHELVELTRRTADQLSTDVSATPAPVIGEPEAPETEAEEMQEAPSRILRCPARRPSRTPAQGARLRRLRRHPPEEAILRATQMAVAGSSRSEIEATLRDEFGLADAGAVVNDILGPA